MPVYNVRGPDGSIIPISGPEGATDEQLTQAAKIAYDLGLHRKEQSAVPDSQPTSASGKANPLMQGSSVMADSGNMGDYLLDRAKRAMSVNASNLAAIDPRRAVSPEMAAKLRLQPLPSREEAAKNAGAALGYQGLRPEHDLQQIAGGGVEMALDPTTYSVGPGGAFSRGMLGFGAGAGAEGMAMLAQTEPGTWGDAVARGGGGMAGAVGTSMTSAALRAGAKPAANFVRSMMAPGRKAAAEQALSSQATSHLKLVMQEALELDPTMLDKVQSVLLDAQKFGVKMPLPALIQNEVINSALRGLASRNPKFADLMKKQFEEAGMSIDTAKRGLFGDPAEASHKLAERTNYTNPAERARAEEIRRIEEAKAQNLQIESTAREMSQKAFPAAAREADFVKRIERVSNEDLRVSPIASKQYDDIAAQAEKDGAALSSASAADLRAMIGDEIQQSNPFHRFPSIIDRAKEIIKPQKDGGFAPIPYSGARDLQQEINAAMRRSSEAADKHHLGNLQERLEEMMYRDMPDHAPALRDANARFAYDANLRDFTLSAVDSKTGILNPEKAAKWISEHRPAIDRIKTIDPEVNELLTLRKSIVDPTLSIAKILAKRVKEENILGKTKVDTWIGDMGMAPGTLVNSIIKNPAFANQALKRFSKDPEGLKALRSYILDEAMKGETASASFAKYMNTKDGKLTIEKLFGNGVGGFLPTVKKLGALSDLVLGVKADASMGFRMDSVKKDWLEEQIGVPIAMLFSKLRNPIISKKQAVIELASKGVTSKQAQYFDDQLAKLLADPVEFAKFVKELDAGVKVSDPEIIAKALKARGLTYVEEVAGGLVKAGALGGLSSRREANAPIQ